jgi:quinol monooxygenase YgiN
MIRKIVRYKVKPEEVEAVVAAIKEFLIAIANTEPETKYEAMQLVDGVNFIHTIQFSNPMAEEQHQKAQYTIKFTDILYSSCEQQPEVTDVKEYLST